MAARSSGSRGPDCRRAPQPRCRLRRSEAGHKSVAAAPGRERTMRGSVARALPSAPLPARGPGSRGCRVRNASRHPQGQLERAGEAPRAGFGGCCPPRPPPGTPGPASPRRAAGLGVGHPSAILGSPQRSPGPRRWSRTCGWTAGGPRLAQRGRVAGPGTPWSRGVGGAAPGSRGSVGASAGGDGPLGAREAGAGLGSKREVSAARPCARVTEGRGETPEPGGEACGVGCWREKTGGQRHCDIFFVKLESGVLDTTVCPGARRWRPCARGSPAARSAPVRKRRGKRHLSGVRAARPSGAPGRCPAGDGVPPGTVSSPVSALIRPVGGGGGGAHSRAAGSPPLPRGPAPSSCRSGVPLASLRRSTRDGEEPGAARRPRLR